MELKSGGIDNASTPSRDDGLAWMIDAAPNAGARTPEELETLLEDALVLRDCEMLTGLFVREATLVVENDLPVHGRAEIARLALAAWDGERAYVAAPRHVIQARDCALILSERTINVARRGGDGSWRYAIVHLTVDHVTEGKDQ